MNKLIKFTRAVVAIAALALALSGISQSAYAGNIHPGPRPGAAEFSTDGNIHPGPRPQGAQF